MNGAAGPPSDPVAPPPGTLCACAGMLSQSERRRFDAELVAERAIRQSDARAAVDDGAAAQVGQRERRAPSPP